MIFLKLILVFQMTLPGVPVIYYGDEAGLKGGKEPENRKAYPWNNENEEIIKFYSKIIKLRKREDVLKKGSLKIFAMDTNICILKRSYEGKNIVVVINNSPLHNNLNKFNFQGVYKELFSDKTIDFNKDNVNLQPYEFFILSK